jgi:hypothetical protein
MSSTAFKIGGVRQVNDGTDVPINSLYVYGVRVTYPSEAQTKIKAVVGQSKPFQYGVEVVRDKTSTISIAISYLNGELIGTSPTHTRSLSRWSQTPLCWEICPVATAWRTLFSIVYAWMT